MNKGQRIAPAWHAEARQIADDNFAKDHANFLNATKRAVWWGLFFNHLKFRGDKKTGDGSIPHGEFGPWLKINVPGIPWRTANTYMSLATGVCEKGNFQIRQFGEFAGLGELPSQILKMIEGHTQQQLFLEFKQVKKNADGDYVTGPGRLPGEGGREAAPDDIEGIIKFHAKTVMGKIGKVDDALGVIGVNFMSQPDAVLLAWQSSLERTNACVNAWLKTPLGQRNRAAMERVQDLYHKR